MRVEAFDLNGPPLPGESEFAEELMGLVQRFRHVPAGARSVYLMTAVSALMAVEKGGIPTASEFTSCLLPIVGRLAKLGMVKA